MDFVEYAQKMDKNMFVNKKKNGERFLENLKLLRDEMELLEWYMTIFEISYNKESYYVLVKRYHENKNKPKYALVKLEFLRNSDLDDTFEVWANSQCIEGFDVKEFREYFNINYSSNLGDIVKQFTKCLGLQIPTKIKSEMIADRAYDILLKELSCADSEDPAKKYCYALRRNPQINGVQTHRSVYNNQKAKMLRQSLYNRLFHNNDDLTISFCFSSNISDNKPDDEIIKNFTKTRITRRNSSN
jgi:hypothetical protein